jgi:hypothetical protein
MRVSYIDYSVLFDMLRRSIRVCCVISAFHLMLSIAGHRAGCPDDWRESGIGCFGRSKAR